MMGGWRVIQTVGIEFEFGVGGRDGMGWGTVGLGNTFQKRHWSEQRKTKTAESKKKKKQRRNDVAAYRHNVVGLVDGERGRRGG